MIPDVTDTIAAIGSAPGGAARAIIRLSGPDMLDCLKACFEPSPGDLELNSLNSAQVLSGRLHTGNAIVLPCEAYLWPGKRSYTCQPSAELHTLGSPPLLELVLEAMCRQGARVAEPGEFTLRAFLAGRLDLTQAEAVLGIVDATSGDAFQTALTQLAGGLSRPLQELREQLLILLAHLEAGLDFVEEDIEFVSHEELALQLAAAEKKVEAVLAQLATRNQPLCLPRVVLAGVPNAGKSSLFNVLVKEFGVAPQSGAALVSEQAGTTRDYLSAVVDLAGLRCELIDTAGTEFTSGVESIVSSAQEMAANQRQQADCCIICIDCLEQRANEQVASLMNASNQRGRDIVEITECELLDQKPGSMSSHPRIVICSSLSGAGIPELKAAIARELTGAEKQTAEVVSATAVRCGESLRSARDSLRCALEVLADHGGEELVAAELRSALTGLGTVVGTIYTDDILDRIFSQFCIGK